MIEYILLAFAILCLIVYITIVILYNKLIVHDLNAILMLIKSYESEGEPKKNKKQARKWYREAAELGNVEAQFNLGVILYHSKLKFNKVRAVKWFSKAAEQGDYSAHHALGVCYEYGDGININMRKALEHYEIAAKMDNVKAIYKLGRCYEYGYGVNKDIKIAVKYYEKAAELGFEDSKGALLRIKSN